MKIDLGSLASFVQSALSEPEILADASQCRARIELEVWEPDGPSGHKANSLTLWQGEPQGPAICLRASSVIWGKVFEAIPPVGHQSLGALRRQCPGFSIEADDLAWAQALPFMERLLEGIRGKMHSQASDQVQPWSGLEHIKGSYLALAGPGQPWVYAERSGLENSPPLLMLHTAGADARQWHGLMADEAMRNDWAMHAFDLPGHGRSPLPRSVPNWHWRLTEEHYLQWVIAYMDAAGIEKAALMGCSMGSAIGLALLAKFPHRFTGAVLLEAPYRAPGRRSKYLNHPEVHGGRLGAAWVGSLLSPSSPKSGKDFATWIYSQAAPGIYDGDLAFYSDDFDAHHHTASIDTLKTPLWLLTGNYDYSATPADSRRVAQEIAGSNFMELTGFGHFPMVENPRGLMPHLQPPLSEIRRTILGQTLEKK